MTYDLTEIRTASSLQSRMDEVLEGCEAGDPVELEDVLDLLQDCSAFLRGMADGES
jgi:hypothetical protein